MNRRQRLAAYVGTLLFSILSTSVSGAPILEVEDNSVITSAQAVESSSGVLDIAGNLVFTIDMSEFPLSIFFNRDVDFYSFSAFAGNEITIDIDDGIGGTASIDTAIGLFGPAPGYLKLAENNDAGQDAHIDGYLVLADGIYTVAVTNTGAAFMDGGEVTTRVTRGFGNGDYLLKISGLSAPPVSAPSLPSPSSEATHVAIGIRPEKRKKKHKKYKAARIDLKKKHKVKVAIYGSGDFHVKDINPSSLTFGAVGNEKTLRKCKHRKKDVNRDGKPDLVCEFSLRDSGFSKYSRVGILNGQTWGGQPFSGADDVVVKGKRKGKRKG